MLVMCGKSTLTELSIFYCTEHMSAGRKKDATFFMQQLKEKVNEVDDRTPLTDCFFFNGASNVQTACAILQISPN